MIRFYTVICVLGFVLPYAALVSWFFEPSSASLTRLWAEIVLNRLSLMAWVDVVITAIVLVAFIKHEGRRMKMNNLIYPIFGTYLVGPSFGLPLFLLLREKSRST